MVRHAFAVRSAATRETPRTAAVPASRPWSAPAASHVDAPAAGVGHDLAGIHVSPPAGAPIQRVHWRWDATHGRWDVVGASSSSPTPPTHTGRTHGEEYDDTYSQDTDPTATPYHRSGASYFGESGALEQTQGRNPAAGRIREPAVGGPGRSGGAGLHEVIPTDLRGWVARTGNEALIGAQSGFRTATDYQLFAPAATQTGEVGGHTGAFRQPSNPGASSHTGGQATAHNTLRDAARALEHETDPDVVVNRIALAHLQSTPHGQEVLQSAYLTGARPNLTAFGGPVGPVAGAGQAPDASRLALARDVHARRELVKARERGRARERDPLRSGRLLSPSPERAPLDAAGRGGAYIAATTATSATTPVPRFEGPAGWENVADQGGWLTQPQRHGFDLSTAPVLRPAPSGGAPASAPVTLSPPVVTPTPSVPPPSPAGLLLAPATIALPASLAPARRVGGRRRPAAKRKPPPAKRASKTPAAAPSHSYRLRKRQRTTGTG